MKFTEFSSGITSSSLHKPALGTESSVDIETFNKKTSTLRSDESAEGHSPERDIESFEKRAKGAPATRARAGREASGNNRGAASSSAQGTGGKMGL